MNDDREHSQPRMLTIHKRKITMPDGKRQMIFYTFDEVNSPSYGAKRNHSDSNSPSYEAERNRRGLGGGPVGAAAKARAKNSANATNTTAQPPPLAEEGE